MICTIGVRVKNVYKNVFNRKPLLNVVALILLSSLRE